MGNDLFSELLQALSDGRLTLGDQPPIRRRYSVEREHADAVRGLAHQTYAEAQAMEEPVWSALKQYGGKITADYVQVAPGRWRIAGEFADIPKRLLQRPPHLNPNVKRVNGNLDQIADAAQMSEQDFKDFLCANPRRATFASALRDAAQQMRKQRKKYFATCD